MELRFTGSGISFVSRCLAVQLQYKMQTRPAFLLVSVTALV